MAKNTAINLDITNNADGFDISGGTTSRKFSISGSDVLIKGSGSAEITFPTINTTLIGTNTTDVLSNKTISGDLTVTGTVYATKDFKAGNISLTSIAIGNVGIMIDGAGSVITTGEKGWIQIPYNGTITSWYLFGDQSGNIVIDVWKDTYFNYPPTVADTIAGNEKPTLSSATKNSNTSLTSWTTSVMNGDIIKFNVDSCSAITKATLSINISKT